MSDLTPSQRARIERVLRRRQRQAQLKQRPLLDDGQKVLLLFLTGCVGLIIFVGFAVSNEWSPGDQQEIARQYRATLHPAAEVVTR